MRTPLQESSLEASRLQPHGKPLRWFFHIFFAQDKYLDYFCCPIDPESEPHL